MNVVQVFDPATALGDTFTVPTGAANGKMVVWNESNISLMFSFQDGSTAYVPAWCATVFCGRTGSVNITWTQQAVLNSFSPPISQVVIEVYAQGEAVPGTFPVALARQNNIGNVISTVTSGATFVQNDGSVIPTSIVEATALGDGSSAVQLNNIGALILGNATHHGSISSDNAAFQTDGNGNVTAVGETLSGTLTAADIASSNTLNVAGHAIFSGALFPNDVGHTLFGSTSGTATLYMPLQGTVKLVILKLTSFRNGSAPAQSIVLPTAFTDRSKVICGSLPTVGIQFLSSSVAQNTAVITALASGGGTASNVATLKANSFGEILSAFDTISFPGSAPGTTDGVVFIIGL